MTSDHRTNDLLSRVSSDVSMLRQDMKNLFSHTTRHTIPSSARDLAECARSQLLAGKDYTVEHLRALGSRLDRPSTAWVGGAVLVGLLAAGAYWFLKSDCCSHRDPEEPDYDDA